MSLEPRAARRIDHSPLLIPAISSKRLRTTVVKQAVSGGYVDDPWVEVLVITVWLVRKASITEIFGGGYSATDAEYLLKGTARVGKRYRDFVTRQLLGNLSDVKQVVTVVGRVISRAAVIYYH